MRVVKPFLALVAAGLIVVPTAQAAPGKRIAKASASGLSVATSTNGRALRPRALLIRITAAPDEPVQVSWNTSCARGGKGRVRRGDYTSTGTGLVRIKQGFKRPGDCLINVLAGYEIASQDGRIEIEVFARGRFARRG